MQAHAAELKSEKGENLAKNPARLEKEFAQSTQRRTK
jgi:hypothetical protein